MWRSVFDTKCDSKVHIIYLQVMPKNMTENIFTFCNLIAQKYVTLKWMSINPLSV